VTPCAPAKKFPFIEQTSLSTSAEQRQQVVQPRTPRSSDATSCAAPEPRPELSESSRPVRFRPVWHQRHLAWCSREATDVLNCLHTKKRKRKKKGSKHIRGATPSSLLEPLQPEYHPFPTLEQARFRLAQTHSQRAAELQQLAHRGSAAPPPRIKLPVHHLHRHPPTHATHSASIHFSTTDCHMMAYMHAAT
jgi:hypothetical protein